MFSLGLLFVNSLANVLCSPTTTSYHAQLKRTPPKIEHCYDTEQATTHVQEKEKHKKQERKKVEETLQVPKISTSGSSQFLGLLSLKKS